MLEDLTVPFVKMKMLDKIEGFYEEMLSQFNSKPCNIINIKHIYGILCTKSYTQWSYLFYVTQKRPTKNKLIATMRSNTIKSWLLVFKMILKHLLPEHDQHNVVPTNVW